MCIFAMEKKKIMYFFFALRVGGRIQTLRHWFTQSQAKYNKLILDSGNAQHEQWPSAVFRRV